MTENLTHSLSVCITFDTDWAHENCIEDSLKLLDEYDASATFFATNNKYQNLKESDNLEIGIHPNFNRILTGERGSIYEVMDELLQLYPNSLGFRSHSLTTSSSILNYAKKRGLQYDSNLFNPYQSRPYLDYSGLTRFTSCWVDYGLLLERQSLYIERIPLQCGHNNILIFHPVHIYLNTPFPSYYDLVKKDVHNHVIMKSLVNNRERGIRDLFIDLLDHCRNKGIITETMGGLLRGGTFYPGLGGAVC